MPGDIPDHVAKNFSLRGLSVQIIPVDGPTLPFHTASFDLAYVNALNASHPPVDELFRVLRPGGKLFALFPAKFGYAFWVRFAQPWLRVIPPPVSTASAAGLRHSFRTFENHRIGKRHLRRAGLPTAWKAIPHGLAERMVGEVIGLRAFKPLRA